MLNSLKSNFYRIAKIIVGFFILLFISFLTLFSQSDKWLWHNKFKLYKFIQAFSIVKYKKIKRKIERININRLKKQEKIRFAFVIYTASMWFLDELYLLLNSNSRFQVSVIVGHFDMNNKDASEKEYEKTINWLTNEKKFNLAPAESVGDFDVLFYLTPFSFLEENINLANVKLAQTVYHVSYSYMLSGNTSKLDLDMYHWSYCYYTDSQFYLDSIARSVERYSNNAKYLGFPKMDKYYVTEEKRISSKKTIIFAPHHSVNYLKFKSATFQDNYLFFLKMAIQYQKEVVWIFKPHPLLRDHCVQAGLFSSLDKYDDYVKQLENTGNVIIADKGEYYSLFKASDAMITDSVSFLAEYQFTGKPLLLLMSEKEEYNDFGKSIVKILYKCSGNNFAAIESFVNDVIEGVDSNKSIREIFFNDNLKYYSDSMGSANKRIYFDMINDLS